MPHLLDTVGTRETPTLVHVCLSNLIARVTAPISGFLSTVARPAIPTRTSLSKLVDLVAEVVAPRCRNVRASLGNPLLENIMRNIALLLAGDVHNI
jgi:hypothetical protein